MARESYEIHDYDVVVVGAGGAGLRAAIEAASQGARTALVCKSLLGKAHTVMAEGGAAAALGNVWPEDNWRVHFRDTLRGGKLLNNWRMVEIFAREAPERILELEEWGAVFDRTPDGLISQRDFGGHRYARLCHVGDRTGLEIIRTLQYRLLSLPSVDVFMECTITRLLTDAGRIAGAFGYRRDTGEFVVWRAPAVVLATGGFGKVWKYTSMSWESTGDGIALALDAGAELLDMEMVQFHPTGMVWPPGARGILVTEGVRGDGGVLRNAQGRRFMFDYIPEFFRAETAQTEEEADRWYTDKKNNRRPPELLPRDEVTRAIYFEVKAGRGTPHGGVYLDIASRRPADYIKRRLPSMYHQFLELAGGLHGANRLGGNSLTDLLVFGRRAGLYAARYAGNPGHRPSATRDQLDDAAAELVRLLEARGEESPFELAAALQEVMQERVGIFRDEQGLRAALDEIAALRERAARVRVGGGRQYNPGWHAARDLYSMLAVAEAVTLSALERRETRGGHSRSDYPQADPELGRVNVVVARRNGALVLRREPIPPLPDDLRAILEEAR
jgi:succinate dehydrogenase / fumarate reductase flavoprotein subunit